MVANRMLYKGWHFVRQFLRPVRNPALHRTTLKKAPYLPRCLAPPKYQFFDFGESDQYIGRHHLPFAFASYGTLIPPEMEMENSAFEVFPVDVWCLGASIQNLLGVSCPNFIADPD